MKLYSSKGAPNPKRVTMFLAEKGVTDVPIEEVSLMQGEHRAASYRAKSPLGHSPALELDDGRVLTESRAICTFLESVYPDPNLMGHDGIERAFIEMWDRRIEFLLLLPIAQWVRHGHPALAALETHQAPAIAANGETKAREFTRWLDGELASRAFVAGDRFTVVDITAFVAIGFVRLMRYAPKADGLVHLSRWQDEIAARASAAA